MEVREVQRVLSNWIQEANSSLGRLAEGVEPAEWIAHQFLNWWRKESVERPLDDAELAIHRIRTELEQLGGWNNSQLGEAMHELIHLSEAITELREALALTESQS